MGNSEFVDDGAIGFHLSGAEIQAVAKRQLAASVAVAIVIMFGVGLTMMRPAHHGYADGVAHRIGAVQQPKTVIAAEHVAAAMQYGIEVP